MCTSIAEHARVAGCGKGPQGWFDLARVHLSYDHPYRAPFEHALTIDFVDEPASARLAVELDRESARALAEQILATLAQADAYEGAAEAG